MLKTLLGSFMRQTTIRKAFLLAGLFLFLTSTAGCAVGDRLIPTTINEPEGESPTEETSPLPPTIDLTPTVSVVTPTVEQSAPWLSISTAVPEMLRKIVEDDPKAVIVENEPDADFVLEATPFNQGITAGAIWVYALVAPFPTVIDNITLVELMDIWSNRIGEGDTPRVLYLSEQTFAALSTIWGQPEGSNIRIANKEELLDLAWAHEKGLAIIPFEDISPRWKVLQVDGLSPLDPKMDLSQYPLKMRFTWIVRQGLDQSQSLLPPDLLESNRDPEKFTTLVLTGTTALAREIAAKMEEKGIKYPLGDIENWLQSADITHISNEVSFYEDCPPAVPVRKEMRFCSDPGYIGLFDAAGVDVIELTGNHNMDWGVEPFIYSLELYHEHGFQTYGGGMNLEEARRPLIIEHAGTRLALLGCNIAGPDNIWATEQTPGAAPCDLDWLTSEVRQLRDEGILPVVTFQHFEVDDYQPMNLTRQHFQKVAEAGAVIVSGSQAHFPHGFAFYEDSFMHYGLGNLFFDQMYEGYRREFIDRHVFYDGRYLGVELLTAMLEDYSRPRPMTPEERAEMLSIYFQASGW